MLGDVISVSHHAGLSVIPYSCPLWPEPWVLCERPGAGKLGQSLDLRIVHQRCCAQGARGRRGMGIQRGIRYSQKSIRVTAADGHLQLVAVSPPNAVW